MKFQSGDIVAIKGSDGSEKRGRVDGIYGNICPVSISWDDGGASWFYEDGRSHIDLPPILTLIERPPRKEKRMIKGFVNVYGQHENDFYFHKTKESAIAGVGSLGLIAKAIPFEVEIEFEVKGEV